MAKGKRGRTINRGKRKKRPLKTKRRGKTRGTHAKMLKTPPLQFQPNNMKMQMQTMKMMDMNIIDWIIFSKWCAVFISGNPSQEYLGKGEVSEAYDIFVKNMDSNLQPIIEHKVRNLPQFSGESSIDPRELSKAIKAETKTYKDTEKQGAAEYMKQVVDDLWPIRSWGTKSHGKLHVMAHMRSLNPIRKDRLVKLPAWGKAVLEKLKDTLMKEDDKFETAYEVFDQMKASRDISTLVEDSSFTSKLQKLDIRPNSLIHGDGPLNLDFMNDNDPEKMGFVEMLFTPIIAPLAMVVYGTYMTALISRD